MRLRVKADADSVSVTNSSLKLFLDVPTGTLQLTSKKGQPVFTGTSGYTLSTGETVYAADYQEHTWSQRKLFSSKGEGREITVSHGGYPGFPDLVQKITVHEEGAAVFLRTSLLDRGEPGSDSWRIDDLQVLTFEMTRKDEHWFSPVKDNVLMMRQGTRMPSDRRILVLLDHRKFPENYNEPAYNHWMRRETDKTLEYVSESFAPFIHKDSDRTLFLGFVTQHTQATQIIATRKRRDTEYLGINCVCDTEGNPLSGNESLDSEELMIDFVTETQASVDEYVEELKARHGQPTKKEVGAMWATWGYYRKEISEAEVIKNMDAVKALGLPVEYIHVDDGYYDAEDEWLGANERFPHGMKWLAEEIRKRGYKPSIWINPFVTRSDSRISREHPEYLLKDKKGDPVTVKVYNLGLYEKEIPTCHPIDYTVPGAREWLRNLMHTLVHEWGYTHMHLDGPCRRYYLRNLVGATRKKDLLSDPTVFGSVGDKGVLAHFGDRGDFADHSVTSVKCIQIAYEIMREVMGDVGYMLGEGYFGPSYGYADAHSVSQDWTPDWQVQLKHMLSVTLSIYPWPSRAKASGLRLGKEPSPHWEVLGGARCEDLPDGLVRLGWTKSAIGQKENMHVSWKVYDLSPEDMKTLHRFLPTHYAPQSRLDDPAENPLPQIVEKKVACSWGEWSVVGLYNHPEEPTEIAFPLKKLAIAQDTKSYHVFEFWGQKYLGRTAREVRVEVPAADAFLLSVRPASSHPEILATDMHYTQGAVELEDVHWDYQHNRLCFRSDFDYQTDVRIFIYVPEDYVVSEIESSGADGLRSEMNGEVLTLSYDKGEGTEFAISFARTSDT